MDNFSNYNIKKYIYYFIVFVSISFFIFLIIYFLLSQGQDLKILISFSLESIISIISLLFVYYTLDGIRLYFVLKSLDYKLKIKDMYLLVFIKYFVSNVTPFTSGGGIAQIYYLQDIGAPAGKSTAAVVLRTVISTTILLIAGPLIMLNSGYLFSLNRGPFFIFIFILFIIIYFSIIYGMVFKNRILKIWSYKILNYIKNKDWISCSSYKNTLKYIFKHLELFSRDIIVFFKKDKEYIFLTLLSTFLFLTAEYSFSYFLLRSLGYYEISYLNIVFLHTIIAFIMYFTPTPGAVGSAEGGFILFYRQFVDKNDIFSLLFFWRFFTKYIGIFLGWLIFSFLIIKNRQ